VKKHKRVMVRNKVTFCNRKTKGARRFSHIRALDGILSLRV